MHRLLLASNLLLHVSASPKNFCKSLTDYTARQDVLETRDFCSSVIRNVCEEVIEETCMDVDQVECEVFLKHSIPSCRSE